MRTDGRREDLTSDMRRALAARAVPPVDRPTRKQLQAAWGNLNPHEQQHVRSSPSENVRVTFGDNTTRVVRCAEFARLFGGAGVAVRRGDIDPHAHRPNIQRGAAVAGTGKPKGE
jgi:hypothetical protein